MHALFCPTLCDPTDCSLPGSFVGSSRQEHWSGLPFPSPGESSRPGTELKSPASLALAGGFFTIESPGKPITNYTYTQTHTYWRGWRIIKFVIKKYNSYCHNPRQRRHQFPGLLIGALPAKRSLSSLGVPFALSPLRVPALAHLPICLSPSILDDFSEVTPGPPPLAQVTLLLREHSRHFFCGPFCRPEHKLVFFYDSLLYETELFDSFLIFLNLCLFFQQAVHIFSCSCFSFDSGHVPWES